MYVQNIFILFCGFTNFPKLIFSIVNLAVNYTKFDRVGRLEADFQHVPLFKIAEIFTILLWNINNLKSVKRSKNNF